jgi:UDP-glucose 4-epimerase
MTIVVTGASGFIGSALLRRLHRSGSDCVGVARSVRDGVGTHRVGRYQDTPDAEVLVHLADNSDRIAASAAGAEYEAEALQLVDALVAKASRMFIYASSALVYGDHVQEPRRPDEPVTPIDPYTRAKLACEARVLAAGGVVARLTNVYGPGMSRNNVMSTVLDQVPGAGPLRVRDDGPVRDFLWIEDAAAAFEAMTHRAIPGIYNLGTGTGTSIRELAQLALAAAGEHQRQIVATEPLGRGSCLVLDITRTVDHLAWQPSTTLMDGLAQLLASKHH